MSDIDIFTKSAPALSQPSRHRISLDVCTCLQSSHAHNRHSCVNSLVLHISVLQQCMYTARLDPKKVQSARRKASRSWKRLNPQLYGVAESCFRFGNRKNIHVSGILDGLCELKPERLPLAYNAHLSICLSVCLSIDRSICLSRLVSMHIHGFQSAPYIVLETMRSCPCVSSYG